MLGLVCHFCLGRDDNLLGQRAIFSGGNEKIETFGLVIQIVCIGCVVCCDVGLYVVDQYALHVINFDVDLSFHVDKIKSHQPVIGVGDDAEVWLGSA